MKPSSFVIAGLLAAGIVAFRGRFSRIQLTIGLLAVAWLVVRGTGLVKLPKLEETAREIGPTLGAWTYLVVGALAFLETAFFVGLIAPGEFAVVLGGFVAGQGQIDVFVLGAIVFVSAAAGDTTSFMLGRKLGRGFLTRHGREFGITPKRLDQVERFFRGHGNKTVLIGRFLGLVRALAPFIAGASKVPPRRFIPVDYLAAALWSVTFVGLGYVFWQSFDTVIRFAKRGSLALGVLVVVIVLAVAAFRFLEDGENRARLKQAWRERSLRPLRDE